MRHPLVGPTLCLLGMLAADCDSTPANDPCQYVDCSSRGYCRVADGAPHCECIAGFHAVGLTCVSDAPQCGDGWADPGEECDDGNTAPGDGCESNCRFSCHADAECDDEDPCTTDSCGATAAGRRCGHAATAGLPCDDGNPCTEPDTCTLDPGGSAHCAGGPNHCACDTTADCAAFEDGDRCNGTLDCIGRVCAVDPATVVICDRTTDTACARNRCDPATGTCRMQAEADGLPCDDGDWCTLTDTCSGGACAGTGARCTFPCQTCNGTAYTCEVAPGYCIIEGACVADGTASPDSTCRGCNPTANVHGWSALPRGSPCDDDAWCNGRETCDGSGACVAGTPPCPVAGCVAGCDEAGDRCVPASNATECRASSGPCDPAERCDGTSLTCPADALRPTGYECRAAAGPCDVAETCSGTSPACPPDSFRPASYECRAAAGPCDVADTCSGTSSACPADRFQPPSYVCRIAMRPCDAEETCTGSSATCPPDASQPDGTRCAFCRTCVAGSCAGYAPLGSDPGSDCPPIECSGYIYGWSGNSCVRYAGPTTNNGTCNGTGGCASVVQSCQGTGTAIPNGTCGSSGCRDTSGSSPCYPGASAPSSFGGPCDSSGGPCFCDGTRHECLVGDVCNPPNGGCGPPT